MNARLSVATRSSRLALAQTQLIVDLLRARGIECDVVALSTKGDQLQDRSLASIGGDGVFSKELEKALVLRRADIAVHSMKDLPTELLAGVGSGVVPQRADPRDVLLACDAALRSIAALPHAAVVGTSSLRRTAQLKAARPDLKIAELRGNVDTRVQKLLDGRYDAIVLALAGVDRLGLPPSVCRSPLAIDDVVPAVGQGALFVQCRSDDEHTQALLEPLNHESSALEVAMERAFLRRMGGGCLVPIGANASVEDGTWRLRAFVATVEGTNVMRRTTAGTLTSKAESITAVERVADEMLDAGARDVMAAYRRN